MAIYNLRAQDDRGRSAVYRYEYTLRVNNFSWEKDSKYDDFLFGQNINIDFYTNISYNYKKKSYIFIKIYEVYIIYVNIIK